MNRRPWTEGDLTRLRTLYPISSTQKLAAALARPVYSVYNAAHKLGLRKTESYYESPESGRLRRGETRPECIATQFPKGHVPANKGLRRPGWFSGRMRETQFKKGERRGVAARNWKPVGTVLPDSEGYLRIKVREAVHGVEPTGFGNCDVWPLLQRHIWEQHHGPVPSGHVVAFKDRNRSHCTIDNLECIPRAELAHRNRMWNRYPRELAEAIQLQGQLKRKLRKLDGEKQDVGLAGPFVRNAGSAEGFGQTNGSGPCQDDQRGRSDDHQFGQSRDPVHRGDQCERRQRVLRRKREAASQRGRPNTARPSAEDLMTLVLEGLLARRAFVCKRINGLRELLKESPC